MRLHYKKNKNVLIHTMSFIKFWKKEVMLPHPVQVSRQLLVECYRFGLNEKNSRLKIWLFGVYLKDNMLLH